jgi:CD63 antigen
LKIQDKQLLFNYALQIGGLLILALGVMLHLQVTGHGSDGGKSFYLGTILFIVIGACIVIISFLGCCGAIKESSCMLTTVRS